MQVWRSLVADYVAKLHLPVSRREEYAGAVRRMVATG
jgi:hypothetical protein